MFQKMSLRHLLDMHVVWEISNLSRDFDSSNSIIYILATITDDFTNVVVAGKEIVTIIELHTRGVFS